ncbi:hypothetical protein BGZ76_010305 [Entomortierella beljakovae]|nr:hypothetical protein BGZ76_010305 [Entomortierella beljakovae]
MKLSKLSSLLTICVAASLLISVQAQLDPPIGKPDKTTTTTTSPTPSKPATTTTTTTTTAAAPVTTTVPTTHATTTKASNTSKNTVPTATTAPTNNATLGCVNASTCGDNLTCVATNATATTGTCQFLPKLCPSKPSLTCTTSAECTLEFSYCSDGFCAGAGFPGTASQCDPDKAPSDNSLVQTAKIAGIAVGSIAALAALFAVIRWKRRSNRSGVPAEMFGEIDYGMTDRNNGSKKGGAQSYPFSSRPNAHGGGNSAQGDYGYDDQYYDEPIGYNNNKQDQYYGNDQYGNGGRGGGYGYDNGHGGHQNDNGFYDNSGYDDYQSGHGGHGHASPVASPARAAMSPRQNYNQMDNYGVEPSELDYGGHGGHGGQGGHGGYGRY